MKENKNASAPKIGMKRDLHINQLKETDVPFALNSNTGQETGEELNHFNEPSNYLAVNFPEGYKVIGLEKYLQGERTFYFLTNPETQKSSIGYVDDRLIESRNVDVEVDCADCEKKNQLGTPLEDTVQTPSKEYVELINDICLPEGEGLNFSINFPIKFISIKVEKGQVNLYWNDYRNPPRWMNTTNTSYLFIQEVPCEDDVAVSCIQIDKLLQFPKYGSFKLDAEKLEIGGNLKMGTYEFYGAYCDLFGNNLSEYFTPTNPVSIFDENNNILSQTELDAYTNFAIKLKVNNLDERYPYYKIVCVERNNVNNTQAAFLEGIHPTTDDTVIYSSSGSGDDDEFITSGNKRLRKRVDLDELYYVKTKYDKAKGTAAINGSQFMWGLYKKPELNLQPVVNLFSSLLKWQTSIAKEDLYKNAVATSKYKGYTRDEVQPFALRLRFKDGGYTSNFPFIARPAIDDERDIIDPTNHNRASIEANAPDCTGTSRTEKWQFINTASVIDVCEASADVETQQVTETLERSCTINPLDTAPAGSTTIAIDSNYIDFATYIEENLEAITDNLDPLYIAALEPYLNEANYVDDHCEAYFEDGCGAESLIDSEIGVAEIENEQTTLIEKCIDDYTKTVPPLQCNPYKRNTTTGEYDQDTDFATNYMPCNDSFGGATEDLPNVYKREFIYYNEDCNYAINLPNNLDPQQQTQSYFHKYYGADTLPELLDPDARTVTYSGSGFETTLHLGALWFKVEKNGRNNIIFEVTKRSECDDVDDTPIGSEVRYTIYEDCNATTPLAITLIDPDNDDCTYTPPTAGLVDLDDGLLVQLDVSTYPDTFYIAIDAPITSVDVPTGRAALPTGCTGSTIKYRVAPPCGCFSVATRDVEYAYAEVSWDSITTEKTETYQSECTFEIPIVGDCDPIPYAYGEFAFWESTAEYPDNPELYDSSQIDVRVTDLDVLTAYDKNRFENYYTVGITNGIYLLDAEKTDFTCQKIRHPKMPDNTIAPFMSDIAVAPFADSFIYPLGVMLDDKVVLAMLNVALNNGLISQEDYDNIEGWEIMRGDNSVSKSVIANGLGYDMYKYNKKNNLHLYSNFPHNDLGDDLLHYTDSSRNTLISHPYNSDKNNRFSFISPDIFLTKPSLPTEVSLSGYQIGNTTGRFVDVEDHPKWTILGRRGRTTADLLAGAEAAIELAIKIAEFTTQGGQGHAWFMAGLASGTNAVGAGISTGALVAFVAASALNGFMTFGQYRYQWLQTFRDLGAAYNFAGYNVSVGHHNKFIKNTQVFDEGNADGDNEYLRGLSVKKYMKDGRYVYRDNSATEDKLFVNNWSREESAFLSLGDYFFTYMDAYKNHDNNTLSSEQGSRTILSQNDCDTDLDYERNVGSPYFTLKNYIPDQFGTIDSIKWLTTNYVFNIGDITTCTPIYGGTINISRFTWKRKIALFTSDAMRLADKLPFNYGEYNNIAEVKYYCDYEADSTKNILGVPFPEIDSNYKFDCVNGDTGFYVKPQSKLYLYYYGIADFLVESEINCNFRYGRRELKDNFYPSVGDIVGWTQQKNVPISEPNTFFYNNTYSLPVSNVPYKILDNTYSAERQQILTRQDNAVIVSQADNDENSITDPWLIFKPLDWYEFPAEYGELIELKGIENGQILARFEDRQLILNAVDNLADRVLPQTKQLGTGNVFNTRPRESNVTDLGFTGTQHHQMISMPFGHITVDAKRGKVHLTNSEGSETISESVGGQPTYMKNWFREHLPFRILDYIPDVDIDNNYKGIGISMGWDARHDRAFLTKLDYIPLKETLEFCNGNIVDTDLSVYADTIAEYESQGYIFTGIEDCSLKFTRQVQELANDTDVYAFWDTSSMLDVDGVTSYNALQTWFTTYQAANPEYTGNLYTIPLLTSRENWVDQPRLILEGSFNYTTAGLWNSITNVPPNLNTVDWQPPENLLLLSFVDETYYRYHDNLLSEGFDGGAIVQPTQGFFIDYQNFLETYPYFNQFKGLLYPIVKSPAGQGGALVLQAMAAIKGTLWTQDEIDATGTTIDVSLLLTENPYENAPIPNTVPQEFLEPLENYNWQGVYDKLSPAADAFSSQQFQDDLNTFVSASTTLIDQEVLVPLTQIDYNDEEYFQDVSWTIAFKPSQGWISYYSFIPNYYSYHNEYFETGYNYDDATLWSHTLTNTSFQVFQGTRYPWIVEAIMKNQNFNKLLKSLEINLEAKRYQNQWDYSQHKGVGFNKLIIYNNTNNSGLLNLVEQKRPSDSNRYPITNANNTQDILYTPENGKHYINYFYNRVKNQDNNIPIWLWNENMINKDINPSAVGFYGKKLLERMKGQQFVVRMIQDKESRFNITVKDVQTREIISE